MSTPIERPATAVPSTSSNSDSPNSSLNTLPLTPAGLLQQDTLLQHLRQSLSSTGHAHAQSFDGTLRRQSHSEGVRPASSLSNPARMVSGSGSGFTPVHAFAKEMGEPRAKARPLGAKARLKKEENGVVKRRDGSVLVRGCILKTDHYPSGRALDLDFHLEGAPNWRAPKDESLNVFGVAQPTLPGLRSILSVLGCRPHRLVNPSHRHQSIDHGNGHGNGMDKPSLDGGAETPNTPGSQGMAQVNEREKGGCVWFCTREEPIIYISGRPFVLREAAAAKTTLTLADRAETLEQIERRLKQDILRESRKYGGLILTHDEQADGDLMATWTAVDEDSVMTAREVWTRLADEGWAVEYHRTPVSSDRPIEDNYLDAYVEVLRDVDPLTTSLVFNDGMGAIRATFAMIAALLVRRKQYLLRDMEEPFSQSNSGVATPAQGWQAAQFMKQAAHQQAQNKSLLRLSAVLNDVLEEATDSRTAAMASELLAANTQLLESLRAAHMGNFQIVLSLLSAIDHGRETKARVDSLIDSCDAVVNLREIIVELRMQYSISSADEKSRVVWLDRAVQALERYFFLIAFASYVEEEDAGSSGKKFADWLTARPEIWTQIQVLRRRGGGRLFTFAPINDLTTLSRAASIYKGGPIRREGGEHAQTAEAEQQANRVVGDEFSQYVIAQRSGIILRAGTLLKVDQWQSGTGTSGLGLKIQGAARFRQVPNHPIFALGQPSEDAIIHVIQQCYQPSAETTKILWLNLREEPVVMICGEPYCLRKENMSLRNLRDYSGMSGSRLEVLEDRLVSDVLAELRTFDNKLLLHNETPDGMVAPSWEDVRPTEVKSLRSLMDVAGSAAKAVDLSYRRLPITAQSTLDFQDIQDMLMLCLRNDLNHTVIILNDQLGRGRSSTASTIFVLVLQWIRRAQDLSKSMQGRTPRLPPRKSPASSWQVVNSCLRVLRRNGIETKRMVDDAIDLCGEAFNCREVIEDAFRRAEEETDPSHKKLIIKDGKVLLSRYLQLIQFQAYLLDLTSDDDPSELTFKKWYEDQPVFKTFEAEMKTGGLDVLTPLLVSDMKHGPVSNDESNEVVMARHGAVLSSGTIIKSDLFLGLQKQSLPERVDGAANYRKVPLLLRTEELSRSFADLEDRSVYGSGMPTDLGLRNALQKMHAGKGGERQILWTSLREEPVLYIAGKPHVLRLMDQPIVNIETTGVSASIVESMEVSFKKDVLQELAQQNRLLLHDEVEISPGQFDIIPIWQDLGPEDIMTPKELYEQVMSEGYRLGYRRIAVTDEQAPLPEALTGIIERVREGLKAKDTDFVFNCQMGRGRTTTGMIAASIVATILSSEPELPSSFQSPSLLASQMTDPMSGSLGENDFTEEKAFLNGEYRMILHLVSVLAHGKEAKRVADRAVDAMAGVQNLREAIYDYKLKMEACDPKAVSKYREIQKRGVNYAYRYAMLIVLTAYLLEWREKDLAGKGEEFKAFSAWLLEKREIRNVLSRQTLD